MSKKGLTEIVGVIDRSGSMAAMCDEAVGGLNAFLEDQKKEPGEASITLVLFDHEYITHWNGIDIQNTIPFDASSYVPRGTTALLDAIGTALKTVGERLNNTKEEEKPEKVLVVILTDGMENASKEFKKEQISQMIKEQREKYSWEFLFLAAGEDAIKDAITWGIDPAFTQKFAATKDGTTGAYASMSRTTSLYRKS